MPGPVLVLASLRYAWRHPWQLALALAGVALGVAVVTAVDLSIASSRIAFERAHAAVAGRATHVLRADPAGVDEVLYADLKRRKGLPVRLRSGDRGFRERFRGRRRRGPCKGPWRRSSSRRLPFVPIIAAAADRELARRASSPGPMACAVERRIRARSLGVAVGDPIRDPGRRPARTFPRGARTDRMTPDGLEAAALSDLIVMDIAAAQELFERIGGAQLGSTWLSEGRCGARSTRRRRFHRGWSFGSAGRRHEVAAADGARLRAEPAHAGDPLPRGRRCSLIYNTMTFSVVRRRSRSSASSGCSE